MRPLTLARAARAASRRAAARAVPSRALTKPRRAALVKHTVTPPGKVPGDVPRPSYARSGVPEDGPSHIIQYSDEELEGIRKASALAAEVREFAASLVRPGVTGSQIDAASHERIVAYGAYPAPLNYMGFPKSVCFAVNEVVCHGIPDERPLENGDIVSIDVSVYVNGYFGDCCGTYRVGTVDEDAEKLIKVTRESLDRSIDICAPGVPVRSIGDAICDVVEPHRYGVVDSFCGHGVGTFFHTAPTVFHCRNHEPDLMVPRMVFTIEPMITEGTAETVCWPDKWTIVTRDGSRCAQFEETITLRDDGAPEILTTTDNFADFFKPLPA